MRLGTVLHNRRMLYQKGNGNAESLQCTDEGEWPGTGETQ